MFSLTSWAQQPAAQDSVKTGFSLGSIKTPNPNSIESKYTYDAITNRYIYTEKIGTFNINYPVILTPKEYYALVAKESVKEYYKEKISAFDGKKEGADDAQKNLLPEFYVKSDFFESIFGSNTIEMVPQGSVEMDLGVLFSKQENPLLSTINQNNFTFDFDQRISLSLMGKVGTRLQVTANYDTESTFDFQNLIKLEYTPTEDDIIQKIEVGNISMPLNSSLITGAQSLFGVKAQLKFGKTTVTGVFSQQKSETNSVVAQGGGTLQEFEFFIRDYDENRHFFLAQYFRDKYDKALATYPYINNGGLQITKIEVWITNRTNSTTNVRNIVALQDLGESDPDKVGSTSVTITAAQSAYPNNENNALDPTDIGGATSQLNSAIREISTVQSGITVTGAKEGYDYSKLENARKLVEDQDYVLNTELGYISLTQSLSNNEVLGVAFQFTVGGKVYQVGEFASDGVEATDVTTSSTGDVTSVVYSNLVVKMLKSSITSVTQPTWDLMMKNIYATGGYNLTSDDFKLNIFYYESSLLNYISPVGSTAFPSQGTNEDPLEQTALLRVFSLDKLDTNNDLQSGGDGFFDFVDGVTMLSQTGKIIFPSVEPFGEYMFNKLKINATEDYDNNLTYNENQAKYVYDVLYSNTKTKALAETSKNKFKLKGSYKSSGSSGISIGSFNVPQGSVTVTANGRVLVEGIDYTVNYQLGTVEILDEALKASDTPIEITTENNSYFGQQTKTFSGINVEHKFNDNFILGGTLLNLNESSTTQKADYGSESVNNTIFGINGKYSTKVPFLTRLVNKLPNIDTDVESNLSVSGEFAYLAPGSTSSTDLDGESTSYIDDFEGSESSIDLKSQSSWTLSSRPVGLTSSPGDDNNGIQNGYGRAMLNWYNIDPVFFTSSRPSDISDNEMSSLYTSRVFIEELFPDTDLVSGETTVLTTLDLVYYPDERGPYNYDPTAANDVLSNPSASWAGISRQLTSTNFEQQNVEYVEFWLQDPFQENPTNPGGKLVFNFGNISEDIVKDGYKLYENGLPEDGDVSLLTQTAWGTVVPQSQSLIYAFDSTGDERTNQDAGYDGYNDTQEAAVFGSNFGSDPSKDNYTYYLNTTGNIFERYKNYNGVQGNTLDTYTDTNKGSTTLPDVEDINRDYTMNTIDSYYEYELPITRQNLPLTETDFDNLSSSNNDLKDYIVDFKQQSRSLLNGNTESVRWYLFRIPLQGSLAKSVGGISDLLSVGFSRIYLKEFTEPTVFRFGTLDLVRSDWTRYLLTLDADNDDPTNDNTDFTIGVIGTLDNDGSYETPPGIDAEEVYYNSTVVEQNEQSLVVNVCDLESQDSRGVFKSFDLDMRQYKRMRMFIHLEEDGIGIPSGNTVVGFIRMGSDITDNYYQIEIPLEVSESVTSDGLWPDNNEINLPLDILAEIKALEIANPTSSTENQRFYNVTDDELDDTVVDEFAPYTAGQHRVTMKGNPSYGDVSIIMVGVKNGIENGANDSAPIESPVCAEVWFNELRLSDMDNEGGWAGVFSLDANIADFMSISATGRKSTSGFGSLEQGPSERSLEDAEQYSVVTNINLGQLLPKKWGVQVPFNYGQSEELITPEYDAYYDDLTLSSRLAAADTDAERETILEQSQDYTKNKSINFIGVRKTRTSDVKPHFYDVENLTFNYSYNKVEHRDYEIEHSLNQTVNTGVNYAFNFNPIKVEPFKKNDSLFINKYWKILKDFNVNLLPSSFTLNSNINRQFTKQKYREVDLTDDDIAIEELFSRTYTFDFQYSINYNLTESLSFNFTAANNNIVRNYFVGSIADGEQDETLDVWDGFFDVGEPNSQSQSLGINYQLPFNKIPTLSFLTATYQYSGNFQWEKGSDLYGELEIDGNTYDLGNTVQNASTHNINSTFDMNKFYKYIGLVKKPISRVRSRTTSTSGPPVLSDNKKNQPKAKNQSVTKLLNAGVDILTTIKRIQFNYSENNGTYMPGYLLTPGFIGTLKPTTGFTFGSQNDIRDLAARRGWLTVYQDFNEQYTTTNTKQMDFSASLEPVQDLKIDLVGNRTYYKTLTENYNVTDGEYNSLTPSTYGNFNISTVLIKTAFSNSDETTSDAFNDFRTNRLIIARRLAKEKGVDLNDVDDDGYPKGFGKSTQTVLLPAFLAAYSGQNPNKVKTSAFRDVPIPNWDLKYTGFMKFKWFKKNFKRFSLTHGYRSTYTVNQFESNLDYIKPDYDDAYDNQPSDVLDESGNYESETLFSNINLTEIFSPLVRIDLEMNNSVKILTEIKKDRLLSLSFDNNLMTEVQGMEYVLGLGYRIKDLRINSNLAGPSKKIVSDLNMKADVSIRDNKTIIRYLDLENNQVTSGQTIWTIKYSADYAFSKNLTGLFYFDYTFSEYAISTAFPQTTIRSGFTIRYNFGN